MVYRPLSPLRRRAIVGAAILAAAIPSLSAFAAEISSTYVGANNGGWDTATNWSPAAVPVNNGTDQYDPSVTNLTVNFDVAGSSNVNSLTLSGATLNLLSGDSLSVVNSGSITGSDLTANDAVFTSSTIATVDSSNLTSTNAGAISLSGLTASTTASDGANYAWSAQGSGSVLTANSVTTLNLDGSATFYLQATGGGLVTLADLTTLNQVGTRTFAIESYDAGSNVNLPSLGNSALSNVSVEIHDGGQVSWGTPTTFNNSTLTIYGASTITVSSLTNVDTSQFSVNNGVSSPLTAGSLSLSGVTSYTGANANVNESWSANGSGSTLTANNLTTLTLAGEATLYFTANNGGVINLNGLTTLNNTGTRNLDFQAFGTGSIINIPVLGPAGINNNNVYIEIHDGGTINWDNSPSFTTTFAGSSLTIYGASTIDAAHLTNVDTSQFSINNGLASPTTPGILSLPDVTSYTGVNANANESWTTNGAGSTLTATNLTTLNLAGQATFFFSANNGGVINLNGLTTLNNSGSRGLDFQAYGANSVINIPALGPIGINNNNVTIEIHDGGTVNWDTGSSFTTTFAGSTLNINGAATIDTAHLTNVDASQFTLNLGATSAPGILSLPSVASYTTLNANVNEAWSANGAGSTLTANNLTTLNIAGQAAFFFSANSGGIINLNALVTLNNSGIRVLDFQSIGAGSTINLAALGPAGINNNNVFIDVRDGGAVNWGAITTFTGSSISINGAATLNTSSLTNVDTSQFSINNGLTSPTTPGILSLPGVTSYTTSSVNVDEFWSANGAGSTLSANSLVTLNLAGPATLFISANSGGIVNLNALATFNTLGTRNVDFQSFGVGSTLNLNALAAAGITNANVTVDVRDGGTVNWGSITTFKNSTLSVSGAATINTASLTNVDASQFSANNGVVSTVTPGNLSLPAVTNYTAADANVNDSWTASGAGSTLSANSLTTLHLAGQANFFLAASSGGTVNLNALTTVDHSSGTRTFIIQSSNLNSNVNLDSLTSLQGADTVELFDHGQATLGGFTSPFTLAFNAVFGNGDGPLDIYINGDFYTSIAANNLGVYESYTFDIPDPAVGTVGFLADGDNAQIYIQDFSATPTSVPEPASLALLAAGSLALLRRRRSNRA